MRKAETISTASRTEALAAFAGVFTSPIRLAILERLISGPCIVGELCDSLNMVQAVVSKQLGLLRDCGILKCQPDGRCREYSLSEPKTIKGILSLMRKAATGVAERCMDAEDRTFPQAPHPKETD